MAIIGELREVITDSGIFYYKIKLSLIFDYMYIYRKESVVVSKKILWWEYSKKKKDKYIQILGDGSDSEGYWYLNKKGDRINNIQNVIKKSIDQMSNFDPVWDGIMCSDKALLRDMLISKILSEEEQEKLSS